MANRRLELHYPRSEGLDWRLISQSGNLTSILNYTRWNIYVGLGRSPNNLISIAEVTDHDIILHFMVHCLYILKLASVHSHSHSWLQRSQNQVSATAFRGTSDAIYRFKILLYFLVRSVLLYTYMYSLF